MTRSRPRVGMPPTASRASSNTFFSSLATRDGAREEETGVLGALGMPHGLHLHERGDLVGAWGAGSNNAFHVSGGRGFGVFPKLFADPGDVQRVDIAVRREHRHQFPAKPGEKVRHPAW